MVQATPSDYSKHSSLRNLAHIIDGIRRSRAFGRLTLRNTVRIGIAHLYFRSGRLVQIVSNRGDAEATFAYLLEWTRGTARFERGAPTTTENNNEDLEQPFDELLLELQRRGVISTPERPRVVEGDVVTSSTAEQLLTPHEWRVLIEGTYRVSLAVAHLVGPQEAISVLRDILEDCSTAFPAFASLQIAPSGYLQVSNTSQLDRMPRKEVLEGFAALIATCQYFCSPIIGEENAHKLITQALGDIGPALVNLGVFK